MQLINPYPFKKWIDDNRISRLQLEKQTGLQVSQIRTIYHTPEKIALRYLVDITPALLDFGYPYTFEIDGKKDYRSV